MKNIYLMVRSTQSNKDQVLKNIIIKELKRNYNVNNSSSEA